MTESLADMSDVPASITIGEQSYELHPLTMGDFAKAERHVRDTRVNQFLTQTRMTPLSDELRARALALIECADVTLADLLNGYESRLYLLYLSLSKGGGAPAWEYMQNGMQPIAITTLTDLMYRITGLAREEETEADSPFPSMTSTTIPETAPSSGPKTSAGTATTSR